MSVFIRISEDNHELLKILGKAEGRKVGSMLDRLVSVAGMQWNEIDAKEREANNQARDHIVREGIKLGKLPEREKQLDGHEGYTNA